MENKNFEKSKSPTQSISWLKNPITKFRLLFVRQHYVGIDHGAGDDFGMTVFAKVMDEKTYIYKVTQRDRGKKK